MSGDLVRTHGDWVVKWIGDGYFAKLGHLVCEFSEIRTSGRSGGVSDCIASDADGHLFPGHVELMSPANREKFVQRCIAAKLPAPPDGAFDWACWAVRDLVRTGEPSVVLAEVPAVPTQWLVPGWIPLGQTTLLYGDGGAGKSTIALALALAALTGGTLPGGWSPARISGALYLDYEVDAAVHAEGLRGLCRPLGIKPPERLRYLRLSEPLTAMIGAVRRECVQHRLDYVILDSVSVASGVEPEGAEAALRTFNAFRTIPATRLAIGHIPKLAVEAKGIPKAFGSVFNMNSVRSAIFVEAEDQGVSGAMVVTLSHRKYNLTRQQRAVGWQLAFDDDRNCAISGVEPDLERATVWQKIEAELRSGGKTAATLAETLDISRATVSKELARAEKRGKVIPLTDHRGGGAGQKVAYGLAF